MQRGQSAGTTGPPPTTAGYNTHGRMTSIAMTNLLEDPSIRTRLADGRVESLSLPAIYAALRLDRVVDFPALRPHQRHAWHAFLAQLATIAMDRAGTSTPPDSAEQWRMILRSLTADHPADEPWRLVVDTPDQPAFMQCPAPKGLGDYRRRVATPDDLDLLVTSKNHDVKQTVATRNSQEDWIFALIDLQTMAGFLGAGNYGIARMNGGFSSRPCIGLAPAEGGVGAHLFHDVDRMLAGRPELLQRFSRYYRPQGGVALLWLEPWDGTVALDLRSLDPYFIEVCRRVRLREDNGSVTARTASSKRARVEAKAANGNLGDFWTPVNRKDSKALSVSAVGFPYKRLSDLMFDTTAYDQPPAIRIDGTTDRRWRLVARGIAGGQGKTEGYHERNDITLAPKMATSLFKKEARDRLADIANAQIEEIAAVTKALRFAIATAASGGKTPKEISKNDRTRAVPYVRRLDHAADARFFTSLERRFLASDNDDGKAPRAEFGRHLIGIARSLLIEAIGSVPCPSIHRHRARAKAMDAFERDLRKGVFSDQLEIFQTRETPSGSTRTSRQQ